MCEGICDWVVNEKKQVSHTNLLEMNRKDYIAKVYNKTRKRTRTTGFREKDTGIFHFIYARKA